MINRGTRKMRHIILSISIGLTASALGLTSASAQTAQNNAIDAAVACLEIEDNSERLSCLEETVTTLKATRVTRIANVDDQEDGEAAAPEDMFEDSLENTLERRAKKWEPVFRETGATTKKTIASGDPDLSPDAIGSKQLAKTKKIKKEKRKKQHLTARVTEFQVNDRGIITAYLENGQVWRQSSSYNDSVRIPKNEKVNSVTIKEGLAGRYRMQINDLKTTIRVQRIK